MGLTYTVYLEPEVHDLRRTLPGNVQQRIRRVFDSLEQTPRPPDSRPLALAADVLPEGIEIHRIRLERWRIVYAVNDAERWVRVLGIYRRPPYDYGDLAELAARVSP